MKPTIAQLEALSARNREAAFLARVRHFFGHGKTQKTMAMELGLTERTLRRRLAEAGLVRHLGAAPVREREASGAVAMRILQEASHTARAAIARRILDCHELLHLHENQGYVSWPDWLRITGSEHDTASRAFFRLAAWLKESARIRLTTKSTRVLDDGSRLVSFSARRLRLFVGRAAGPVEEAAIATLTGEARPRANRQIIKPPLFATSTPHASPEVTKPQAKQRDGKKFGRAK